jgi:hypothetical protein
MIFYHFTTHRHVAPIRSEGLRRGDVPTSMRDGVNGIWFTSSSVPSRHDLTEIMNYYSADEADAFFRKSSRRLRGVLGKCEVRIRVAIPITNRALVAWSKWGREHCDPHFFEMLNCLGPAWRTWYVFFGIVRPTEFQAIDVLIPRRKK